MQLFVSNPQKDIEWERVEIRIWCIVNAHRSVIERLMRRDRETRHDLRTVSIIAGEGAS